MTTVSRATDGAGAWGCLDPLGSIVFRSCRLNRLLDPEHCYDSVIEGHAAFRGDSFRCIDTQLTAWRTPDSDLRMFTREAWPRFDWEEDPGERWVCVGSKREPTIAVCRVTSGVQRLCMADIATLSSCPVPTCLGAIEYAAVKSHRLLFFAPTSQRVLRRRRVWIPSRDGSTLSKGEVETTKARKSRIGHSRSCSCQYRMASRALRFWALAGFSAAPGPAAPVILWELIQLWSKRDAWDSLMLTCARRWSSIQPTRKPERPRGTPRLQTY